MCYRISKRFYKLYEWLSQSIFFSKRVWFKLSKLENSQSDFYPTKKENERNSFDLEETDECASVLEYIET